MSDTSMPQDVPPPISGSTGPADFAPDAAISYGWRVVKSNPVVIFVLFVAAVVSGALPAIGSFIETSGRMRDGLSVTPGGGPLYWTLFVVNLPLSAWVACGTWRYLFKIARGQPGDLSDVFSGGPLVPMLGALVLFMVGAAIGTMLCVVPGVIFMLGCWFYAPLIIDRNCAAVDSLKASWELTKGRKGQLFVLMLLMIVVAIAGIVACCVGVIVSLAIIQLAMVYAYMKLTGQAMVEPA